MITCQKCLKILQKTKKPHVYNFSTRNSGARNGCANLLAAWFFGSFCWKTPMPIKFLVLGGLGFFLERERGSANFIFMAAGIFLKSCPKSGVVLANQTKQRPIRKPPCE